MENTQAQLQQELADTQAQLAFNDKKSKAEIKTLDDKLRSSQSIASERLARLNTPTGVYEENERLQLALTSEQVILVAKSSELLAVQERQASSSHAIGSLKASLASCHITIGKMSEANRNLQTDTNELQLQVAELKKQSADRQNVQFELSQSEKNYRHLQADLAKVKDERDNTENLRQSHYEAALTLGTERNEVIKQAEEIQSERDALLREVQQLRLDAICHGLRSTHNPAILSTQSEVSTVNRAVSRDVGGEPSRRQSSQVNDSNALDLL